MQSMIGMPGMDMKGGDKKDMKDMPMAKPSPPTAPQASPSGEHPSHQR
jgi:hypothetical protein